MEAKDHFCTIEKATSGSFLPPLNKNSSIIKRPFRTLQKIKQISMKDPRTKEFFRSSNVCLRERRRHAESKYRYIIHPFSNFVFYRELILMITYVASFVTIPTIAMFIFNNILHDVVLYPIEMFSTVCLTLNIFLTFFIGVVNKETKTVILDHKVIVKNYVFSRYFIPDILMSFSFVTLKNVINLEEYYYLLYFRMVIVLRIGTLFEYWHHVASRFDFPYFVEEITKFIFLTVALFHWMNCVMFYMMYFEKEAYDTLGENYIYTLYSTFGILLLARSVWSENSSLGEIMMTILASFIGFYFMLLLLVFIVVQVLNYWSLETKYMGIMDQLVEYMRYKKLPIALRKRMKEYFEYRFQNQYFRESAITSILSDKLKREINIHVCRKLVQKASFLSELPTKVLGDILVHLKSEIFLPNDIIIRAGAPGDCLYFLASGTVLVSTPSGKEVCHLTDGAYFGEIALVSKETKRTANVTALEICETYRLDKRLFKLCMRKNPDCLRTVQLIAEMRHQKTNALEEMYKEELFHKTYIGDQYQEDPSMKRKSLSMNE